MPSRNSGRRGMPRRNRSPCRATGWPEVQLKAVPTCEIRMSTSTLQNKPSTQLPTSNARTGGQNTALSCCLVPQSEQDPAVPAHPAVRIEYLRLRCCIVSPDACGRVQVVFDCRRGYTRLQGYMPLTVHPKVHLFHGMIPSNRHRQRKEKVT